MGRLSVVSLFLFWRTIALNVLHFHKVVFGAILWCAWNVLYLDHFGFPAFAGSTVLFWKVTKLLAFEISKVDEVGRFARKAYL